MSDRIVITAAELQTIEDKAVRSPSKDGTIAPRVVKQLIALVEDKYGIDLGIETEDMANEREKREAKLAKARGSLFRRDRDESDNDSDHF